MLTFPHTDILYAMSEAGAKKPKKGEEESTKKTPAQMLTSLVLPCPTHCPRRVHVSLCASAVAIRMLSDEATVAETAGAGEGSGFAHRDTFAYTGRHLAPGACDLRLFTPVASCSQPMPAFVGLN